MLKDLYFGQSVGLPILRSHSGPPHHKRPLVKYRTLLGSQLLQWPLSLNSMGEAFFGL